MMTKKTSESGWAIPDDWDGVSWRCVALRWPDSPKFDILLRGLLYSLTRGRDWDRFTGSVKTAQTYGWLIFDRNSPFVSCADSEDCPECPPEPPGRDSGAVGCGALIESEDTEVGQVVTDVTVEGGRIRVWFGPCCYHDLTGITVSQVTPDVGENPLVPSETGEPPSYSACGKAAAILHAVDAVLVATYDAMLDVDWPWQILGHVEQAVGYNLDNKWLAALWIDWQGGSAVGLGPADVFSDIDQQNTLCALVNLFEDNAVGVPDDEAYEGIKALFHSRNLIFDGLIMTAINCLGRGNLDTIAKLGAADTEENCDCYVPAFGEDFDTTGLDWFMIVDLRTTAPPAGTDYSGQHNCPTESDAYIPGIGLAACPSEFGRCQVTMSIPVLNTGALSPSALVKAGVRFKTHAGDEYKLTVGYQKIGFDNGEIAIQPGLVDSTPVSVGGIFDWFGAVVPDSIAGATEFKIVMDYDPLAEGFIENDPTTGNVIEQFFIGGSGVAPQLWPEA